YLYVFYNRLSGHYILMAYNLISQGVESPIVCNGYTIFEDGELVYFRDGDEAQKHHVLQVWRTPFSDDLQAVSDQRDSFLFKVGNADIVKCMAECHEILNLLRKEDSYEDLYVDLASKSGDVIDTYFWCGDDAAHNLRVALEEIKEASESAISAFENVSNLRSSTAKQMQEVGARASETARRARSLRPDDIIGFVDSLSQLRAIRGEVISLRDLRYHDETRINELEKDVVDTTGRVSNDCVDFLLKPVALDPYRDRIAEEESQVENVKKVAEAEKVREELDKAGTELEMLIDIVGNLRIEDATETTKIIDDISAIYAKLNSVRSVLKNRRLELAKQEGEAQFGAQIQLVSQSVVNFLDLCDTPAKCDDYLSRVMIQLEELEGKFAEFDDYVVQVVEKRDEIYNAFESRKVQLLEKQNARSTTLHRSAGRILTTIQHRVAQLEEVSEINGYLAGDLMVEKVRNIVEELTELGDSIKADDVRTKLKTVRDDAVRQLKDRKELFVDGQNVIQFGSQRFSVNQQELELSIVPHDGGPAFHLSGTEFFEEVTDEVLLSAGDVAKMNVVSENEAVYRAEFLAWSFFRSGIFQSFELWDSQNHEAKLEAIQLFISDRYEEAYTKGVHDEDAIRILNALIEIDAQIGLLRYSPISRSFARVVWASSDEVWRTEVEERIASVAALNGKFETRAVSPGILGVMTERFTRFLKEASVLPPGLAEADPVDAAKYWFEQLLEGDSPVISERASDCITAFLHELTGKRLSKRFSEIVASFSTRPASALEVALEWIVTVLPEGFGQLERVEAATVISLNAVEKRAVKHAEINRQVEGLTGQHSRINSGMLTLDFVEFTTRLSRFDAEVAPAFREYQHTKVKLIEEKREAMRLEEFKPKVMSAFVRNRLLDRVYLPLIGDNLAKQMGTAGDDTRTDRMGMLLLISPPGYGKTTLMEYIANRLGITFMKINGPALGHEVTSLDPNEAPNASAREEVQKLNLALEMGDNVMIYLDDIQHTHPEFLQKFISLCDAQRKIEGVWNGKPRTYDLRGKKVCVVMAGNPYTESGGKFQIPDMLANRADTYNLGDIIGEHSGDFEASYIENSITSSAVLSRLSSWSQEDVYAVMQIAESGSADGVSFDGNYSPGEIDEMVSVMRKLMRVRDTILRVNLEYIRSAAMEDAYRTEPPFRLQGSYRNMNRIAEKILPIMTDAEVESVIVEHYENESQTLTTGAESNLLRFREMEGTLSEEDAER
ncbi:MAG: DNA repair ATPase, partial [Verrucomicrobiota bacterium]